MYKVQKLSSPHCNTPSSEPFRIVLGRHCAMNCQIRRNLSVHVLNLRRTCLKACRHDSTSSKFPPSKCSIVNILKRTLKRISTQKASFQNPCTVSAIERTFRLRCSHFYLERLCSAISIPIRIIMLVFHPTGYQLGLHEAEGGVSSLLAASRR
jgi:hypothetical protein